MDLIAQLVAEHQDYVLKLTDLIQVVEGIRINGRGDYFIAAVDDLLEPLTTDLDHHARREEDFLFPLLEKRVPDSPVPTMREEHAAIRRASTDFATFYRFWRAGEDAAFPAWAEPAVLLRGTFSVHMQKENLILFPMLRRVLTAEELSRLTELAR
jgi:hemerythrin-like domain-containing protein